MNDQKEFYVGQKVEMQGTVMTIQFINDDRVTCSFMQDNVLHSTDVNVKLIKPYEATDWLNQW